MVKLQLCQIINSKFNRIGILTGSAGWLAWRPASDQPYFLLSIMFDIEQKYSLQIGKLSTEVLPHFETCSLFFIYSESRGTHSLSRDSSERRWTWVLCNDIVICNETLPCLPGLCLHSFANESMFALFAYLPKMYFFASCLQCFLTSQKKG